MLTTIPRNVSHVTQLVKPVPHHNQLLENVNLVPILLNVYTVCSVAHLCNPVSSQAPPVMETKSPSLVSLLVLLAQPVLT
jgi:hypothetical protein